jgi:protein-disulfide isomerase
MRVITVLFLLLPMISCRPDDPSESFPDDIDGFDASLPDGSVAEPVAACMEEEPRFNNNLSPAIGGNVSVDVEVVHFSSFYCHYCAQFAAYSDSLWRTRTDFQDRARIYFHHASYRFRHRAAVAAFNQGEDYFWKLHGFIFSRMLSDTVISDDDIIAYVRDELKLDMTRFNTDLSSDETYSFLKWDIIQGAKAGVSATPTLFVCGEMKSDWYHLEDHVAGAL